MRHLLLTATFALGLPLLAPAAMAGDVALVLGNERYDTLGRLPRGAEVTVATAGLSALGFDISVLRNGDAAGVARTLEGFLEVVPDAGRIVVALSGRFVTDGERTWFLTADAGAPGILTLGETAIPVDSLLAVLARAPGQALLLLGADPGATVEFDPWLHEGIGALDIPQGVTVLTGEPRPVADFLRDALGRPEGDLAALLAEDGRLVAAGFLPASFPFMPALPEVVVPPAADADRIAADEALWRRVMAQDNVEAYRGYLRQFPEGRHIAEAQTAIAAILSEPFRDERLAEEALGLTREQRRDIQSDLTTMGFDTRGIDGIFGQGTRRAIMNWQQENGFAQSGYLTMEQVQRLDGQAARRAAEIATEAERQRQEAARLDRAYWEETGARGDEAGLRAYLMRHPQGMFAAEAQQALERILRQAQEDQAARESGAWETARRQDSARAYRDYLRAFPEGPHAAEARARIAAIEGAVVPVDPAQPPGQGSEPGSEPGSGTPQAGQAETDRARAVEEALGLNSLTLRLIESRLAGLGLDPGEVDGRFDNRTRRAIRRYQEENGIAPSGYLDEQTMVRILAGVIGN